MNYEKEQPAVAVGAEARDRPLLEDLRALADDGLRLAKAEIGLQKARGQFAAGRLKWIASLGALAAVLVCLALVALTVGMVIALTPVLGAFGATLAVFAALLVFAIGCALAAAGQWKRMVAALSNAAPPSAPASDSETKT